VGDEKNEAAGGSGSPQNFGEVLQAIDLQESEYFRQIADNLRVVFALSNADLSQFLYVNRAYQDIWGRAPETLYAHPRSFLDAIHQDDREKFERALVGLIQGKPITDLEARVVRPDSSTVWVSCRGFPVRDAQGQIQRLVGSAQDITERKRAENQLRESEDRYRDLVEHSHALICTHDLEGILLSVNDPPLQILGYSREELLNKPMREFVPVEARPHCDAYLAQIRRDGFAKGILPVLTKSGELRLWEFQNSLRMEGVSSPVVRGLAHDVTDQKRAQEQLLRSQAILAEGQRLTHTGSWIWNPMSGEFLVSPETARIFEFDEASRKPSLELFLRHVHPEDKVTVEQSFNQAAVGKRDFAVDCRISLLSGALKNIHCVGRAVFKSSGTFIEFIGTVMDVTERKRTEDELRWLTGQLLHLHDEERRKIAQDLHDTTGQNLAAVINMLGLIQQSIRSSKDQKCQDLVSECEKLANQCLHEIRTLSYVLFPPTLEKAGIESAIRHYVKGFIERTGIRVEFEVSGHLERLPKKIELALFHVVRESLVNVQRHSGSSTAQIRLERQAGVVSLEVSDRGRGMLKQKENGEAKPVGGVGIAIAKERVKQFGGVLDIESSDVGTTVRVRIPINESKR
jgi:PAS domain S-box-containing protein